MTSCSFPQNVISITLCILVPKIPPQPQKNQDSTKKQPTTRYKMQRDFSTVIEQKTYSTGDSLTPRGHTHIVNKIWFIILQMVLPGYFSCICISRLPLIFLFPPSLLVSSPTPFPFTIFLPFSEIYHQKLSQMTLDVLTLYGYKYNVLKADFFFVSY